MAIREDDQRLKDMMRAIELGEIEEDVLEGDSEDYEDMGGIKSLKNKAPSIKLASETGPEEFELELMSVIREFNDLKQKGLIDPDVTVDEYINDYLSKKKMKMEQDRQMAMYGGRMQYAGGTEGLPKSMMVDTTTSAYGDAGKGRDVPAFLKEKRLQEMKKLEDMIKKAKDEKKKLAKGGIAGVL